MVAVLTAIDATAQFGQPREPGRWGKAGVRLTDAKAKEIAQRAGHKKLLDEQAHDKALSDWWAGRVVPHLITMALDADGLYGPDVDRACLVAEPTVDRWEAGEVYPSWEQLCALAELTGKQPSWFMEAGQNHLTEWDTTMRFHAKLGEPKPPVLRFTQAAIDATVAGPALTGYQAELF